MSSLFKRFETNKKAEEEGVWIEYPANEDGTIPAFKLARSGRGNKRWLKAVEKNTKPHRRAIELETISRETSDAVMRNVFIESILTDWRNVQGEDNEALAFTAANAETLFAALPDLYDELNSISAKNDIFRSDALEVEAKN